MAGYDRTFTVADIMAMKPCYSRQRVSKLFAGRETLLLSEILAMEIPAEDRIWVATKRGVLPDGILRWWACDCADSVKHLRPNDSRLDHAVEVARRYALGQATVEDLRAARSAAGAAAGDAAWAAVRAVAGDAYGAAARAAWAAAGAAARAAWAAAGAASGAAAEAAAWDAAWDAAWCSMGARLRDYVTGSRTIGFETT